MPENPFSWVRRHYKNRKVTYPSPHSIPARPVHPGLPMYLESGAISVDLRDPLYTRLTKDEIYYIRQFMS